MLKEMLILYLALNLLIAVVSGIVSCFTNHLMPWTNYVYGEFKKVSLTNKIAIWISLVPSVIFEIPITFICFLVLLVKFKVQRRI